MSGSLGERLDPLVNTVILPTLKPLAANTLSLTLSPVLTELVDPLLMTLGVRIGEVDVSVLGVGVTCSVAGNIYNDLNRDGVQSADEGWLGGTYVFVNVVKDGIVTASAAIDPETGQFYLPEIPEGDCTLLLATSQTSTSAQAPEGFGFMSPDTGNLSLEVNPSNALIPSFGLKPLALSFLLISERVRNVTVGETEFTTANSGKPGNVLEYCVRYVNLGVESVRNVVIQSAAPRYTTVENSVADYGGKAIKLTAVDGTLRFLSSLSDGDIGDISGGTVRVRLNEVRRQAFGSICYRARIK